MYRYKARKEEKSSKRLQSRADDNEVRQKTRIRSCRSEWMVTRLGSTQEYITVDQNGKAMQ